MKHVAPNNNQHYDILVEVFKIEIKVKFFANFSDIAGTQEETFSAKTVKELLKKISKENKKLGEEIFDDEENLKINEFVNIMVNGRRIELLEGIDTKLGEEDTVAIFPPISGG